MTTKHTPGPWFVGCNGGEKIQIVVCESKVHDEPTGLVAEVNKRIQFTPGSDPMRSPTAEANARLIAAAPELAEALRAALPILAEAEEKWSNGEDCYSSVVAMARQALAKAGLLS